MFKKFRTTTLAMVLALVGLGVAKAEAVTTAGAQSTREIAPGVFSFVSGSGYHSMFAVTNDGVAAFETVNSKHAASMLEAIKAVTDQPVKFALQSHNHWDHSSGGKVMQDAGAQTVMHLAAAKWLAANPGRDTTMPDITWEGARNDISIGDISIQQHHVGMSHGLGMTVFVIPERKVAYIADLVTPNRVMFSIVPDFNIGQWERSLGEILEMDFDVAVCSHNDLPADEALNGCTKEDVAQQRAFIGDLRNAIFAEFEKGTPPKQIPAVVKLPQYAHWNHYEDWLPLNAQRLLLDLWMGPYPWSESE